MTGDAVPRRGITVDGVVKDFHVGARGRIRALDGVTLHIAAGEFVAVIGPSGCGKSTILRLIASLDEPSTGSILVDGRSPTELAHAHRLGVAFQDHALLPWLNCWQNVALPFHIAGQKPDPDRISSLINLVGLQGFEKARPKQLSGGMKQRLTLARALALDPDVLLLDEPFGALDAITRQRLNLELQAIWAGRPLTTMMITHSVDEAVFMADRVIVISPRPGRVILERHVPVPRPRQRSFILTPEFHSLTDELTLSLHSVAP